MILEPTRDEIKALAAELQKRAPELLQEWFPLGQLVGDEFQAEIPYGFEKGSFLRVNIKTGAWAISRPGPGIQ